MPNQFVGHVDRWLTLSQSDTDFTALFVRAWIPFNAWYVNHYQNTRDRACIDLIKIDNNQFRARLIALLENESDEALEFKLNIYKLQRLLEAYPIPDATNQISLKKILFRNNPVTVTMPVKDYRGRLFKAELYSGGNVDVVVLKKSDNSTVYSYIHNRYDLNHFKNDLRHSNLSTSQQSKTMECFNEINPKIKENLISGSPRNSIRIKDLYLKNDPDLLSQAIIELLYSLRNKLFHGEIQPSKANFSIYEPAYFILRTLLNSLS